MPTKYFLAYKRESENGFSLFKKELGRIGFGAF
jgi:hypothetical protein